MINDIEICNLLLEKLPIDLCNIILSFRPTHNYIKELKHIKKICFDEYREWLEDEGHDININDYGLFELLLESQNCNIVKFKILSDKINFDEFDYKIYLEYICIYSKYDREIDVLDIPDSIIEKYFERKNDKNYEQNYRNQFIYDGCFRDAYIEIPFFRHDFRIPEEQIIKYKKRLKIKVNSYEYDY
jgi:hypothetical protein